MEFNDLVFFLPRLLCVIVDLQNVGLARKTTQVNSVSLNNCDIVKLSPLNEITETRRGKGNKKE